MDGLYSVSLPYKLIAGMTDEILWLATALEISKLPSMGSNYFAIVSIPTSESISCRWNAANL